MALNEVLDEIRASRRTGDADAAKKPVRSKREPKNDKPMTKAELDAFRERKMREEEERYLGKAPKRRTPKKRARADLKPETVRQDVEIMHDNQNPPRSPRKPKMLEPLQPLYLLKVPGLPKGDCLAICLVHGVEP